MSAVDSRCLNSVLRWLKWYVCEHNIPKYLGILWGKMVISDSSVIIVRLVTVQTSDLDWSLIFRFKKKRKKKVIRIFWMNLVSSHINNMTMAISLKLQVKCVLDR